ncbi:MAG TPA: hypothetical protein VN428_06235 [Bryobacteraceae bacterium]|nr:hypothetical protein [Bryobacteraceae bacterium]
MPFQNCLVQTFKTRPIQRSAPASSGVYGLSNAREWIYIGETDNIQARLLDHLAETTTLLAGCRPTGFSFEVCDPTDRAARRRRLILELAPACAGDLAVAR